MSSATATDTTARRRVAREALKAGVKAVKSLITTIDGGSSIAIEDIAAAASAYHAGMEAARVAERDKRRARKLLDAIPDGFYGAWHVFRKPPTRETPDLEAIRAVYTRYGLGDVPMKKVAPSLAVEPFEGGRV